MKNKYGHLDKKMKELYLSGKSSPTIAKELNIKSHSIVQRHLRKIGIKLRTISEDHKGKALPKETKEHMKGRVPWNKGKKDVYSKETLELMGKSKRGKIPWNYIGLEKEIKCDSCNKIFINKENKAKNRFCSMKCCNDYKRNHPEQYYTWLGGKSFEPYDIKFNNNFKNNIRKRDNQVCMLCGIHREKLSKALAIHHINYDKKLSIPENCISLCDSCHSKTNANRENWIVFFQSILSKHYSYAYSDNKEIVIKLEGDLTNEI